MQLKFIQPHLVTKYNIIPLCSKLNNNNNKNVKIYATQEEEKSFFFTLKLKHILIKIHNFAMLMLTKRSVSS